MQFKVFFFLINFIHHLSPSILFSFTTMLEWKLNVIWDGKCKKLNSSEVQLKENLMNFCILSYIHIQLEHWTRLFILKKKCSRKDIVMKTLGKKDAFETSQSISSSFSHCKTQTLLNSQVYCVCNSIEMLKILSIFALYFLHIRTERIVKTFL